MIRVRSTFLQQTVSAVTFVFVLGALSMIWPSIMALVLGAFLLIQSCCIEQAITALLLDRSR
ncbi:MAG: hypothetical protein HP491_12675 [Nitrospira sp.]|nr:hypothetical protein [Nitrospira sp.]MBH0184272.1 hypothetical protein [Nitrospira sp.]